MASMYLALGYQCNHHCFFCPCGKNAFKTMQASEQELIQAIEMGIQNQNIDQITLSGGEPTLHPSFNRIAAFCIKRGIYVSVLSNGETFYKESNVQRFFDKLDPCRIQITTALHSDEPALHERVTGVTGSFGRSVQGLKNVMKCGIAVTVKQVSSRWNYKRLPQFVDFTFGTFGPRVSLTICGMDFCGMNREQIEEVAVGYQQMRPYLEEALIHVLSIRNNFQGFPRVTVADLPLCSVDPYYWGFFTKVSRGEISQYSAPANSEGHVESSNQIINDCDTYFKACRECHVNSYCPGVWRTASQFFEESEVSCVHAVL